MALADRKVISKSGDQIDPSTWDAFIQTSPQGAVFLHHGYMSIIAPAWKTLLVTEGEKWVAVLPYVDSSRWGVSRSLQPRFAQYWGICFSPGGKPGYQDLSDQKSILDLLLPHVASFQQIIWHLSPAVRYPLPFHWAGFTLQSRYTFRIDLTQSEETLLSAMSPTTRRYLRKGESLTVEESEDTEEFLRLFTRQREQGHEIISSNDQDQFLISNLVRYLSESQTGKMMLVKQENGEVLAGGLFGLTNGTCTYLLGTYDPDRANRSAMPVMMWTMMKEAQQHGLQLFDFEGSMLEGVERFFRRMGGQPVPYLRIEKNDLPLLAKWINALRS